MLRTKRKYQKAKKKRMLAASIAALLMSGAVLIGGVTGRVSAYFTDTKSTTNTFEVGTVETELTEPEWDPDDPEHEDITPNQTIAKDPTITNVGESDTEDGDDGNAAYVFMTVTVPTATVIHANLDGSLANNGNAELIDLFTYEVNSGWELLGLNTTSTTSEDGKTGTVTYTYAYATATNHDSNGVVTSATLTPLEVGESSTLFNEVTFANVIEDQGLEDVSLDIVINSYAIQTDDLTISGSGITDAYEVLQVIYNQIG